MRVRIASVTAPQSGTRENHISELMYMRLSGRSISSQSWSRSGIRTPSVFPPVALPAALPVAPSVAAMAPFLPLAGCPPPRARGASRLTLEQ